MKKVTLNIIFMKAWKMVTICTAKTIGAYLKSVLKDKIDIEDNKLVSIFNIRNSKKICWFILDDKNNLLSIDSKVPKKLNILGINLDILKNVLLNYNDLKETIKLNTYLNIEYDIELIPGLKEEEIKEPIKEETIETIIKPAVVVEKKEELEVISKPKKKELPKKKEEPKKEEKKELPKSEKKEEPKKEEKKKKEEIKVEEPKPKKKEEPKKEKKEESPKKEEIKEKTPKKKELPNPKKKEEPKKEEKKEKSELEKKKELLEAKKKELEKKKKELEKNKEKDQKEKPNNIKIVLNMTDGDNPNELTIISGDKKEKKEEVKEEKEVEQKAPQTITYVVTSPDGTILYNKTLEVMEPMTIEQLLFNTGLPVKKSDYIRSIGGIDSNDEMSKGWVYEINGEWLLNTTADTYIVNPNDTITWKYVGPEYYMSKLNMEENEMGGKTR